MESSPNTFYETLIKPDKTKNKRSMFYYIRIWMLFTVVITVFTAFVVKIPLDRNIIILEALISTISTIIYYFLDKKIVTNIEKMNLLIGKVWPF